MALLISFSQRVRQTRGVAMNRFFLRHRTLFAALSLAALVSALGCQSALFTAMYLLKGTDVDPDFKDLKGKKVVVVCRPMVSLQYANSNVGRELAQDVAALLQEKVPKIKVVESRKVDKWTDEHSWEEYTEVGKAMKADMVVGIDLEGFSILQGQTLLQGKANAMIKVYDLKKNGPPVFHKPVQCVYPPSAPIPASERSEPNFRAEFEMELANVIGRYFYKHDPYTDIGKDAAAMR
jgi:hypothetical protein